MKFKEAFKNVVNCKTNTSFIWIYLICQIIIGIYGKILLKQMLLCLFGIVFLILFLSLFEMVHETIIEKRKQMVERKEKEDE